MIDLKKLTAQIAVEVQAREDRISELRLESERSLQKHFEEVPKAFFEKWPDVYAIHWKQYTPHWNDGEECYFTLSEFEIALTEEEFENDDEAYYHGILKTYQEAVQELADWKEWEADKAAYEAKHRDQMHKVGGRYETVYDRENSYRYGRQEYVGYTLVPHYGSKEREQETVEFFESLPFFDRLEEIDKDWNDFKSFLKSFGKEALEGVFGNYVHVILSKDGVDTEDYDAPY